LFILKSGFTIYDLSFTPTVELKTCSMTDHYRQLKAVPSGAMEVAGSWRRRPGNTDYYQGQ